MIDVVHAKVYMTYVLAVVVLYAQRMLVVGFQVMIDAVY